MGDFLEGIVYKEEFDLSTKIGIADNIIVYTEKYPLLSSKKPVYNEKYQAVSQSDILFLSGTGTDFFLSDNIVSYLNFENYESIYLGFSSNNNSYYNTVNCYAISGNVQDVPVVPYSGIQQFTINERTRIALSEYHGLTINVPYTPYIGDVYYQVNVSGSIDTGLYIISDDKYFVNDSLLRGEVVFKPTTIDSVKTYNYFDNNYPYQISKTFYRDTNGLLSGQINDILVDDLGNTLPAIFSGFAAQSMEIPIFIDYNEKYFNIYKQDNLIDRTTRVKLENEVDYKIDFYNGKITLFNALGWDSDTVLWIENYIYDKIYYNYISSSRSEIGDIDKESYQYQHLQLKKMFHKGLEKILFWIPLSYSIENDLITPRLDNRMTDFVSEMTKILTLQMSLNRNMGNSIKVQDGDTSIDLVGGLSPGKAIVADQVSQLTKKLRADVMDYITNQGYMGIEVESSQETTGSLY